MSIAPMAKVIGGLGAVGAAGFALANHPETKLQKAKRATTSPTSGSDDASNRKTVGALILGVAVPAALAGAFIATKGMKSMLPTNESVVPYAIGNIAMSAIGGVMLGDITSMIGVNR